MKKSNILLIPSFNSLSPNLSLVIFERNLFGKNQIISAFLRITKERNTN